MYKENKNIVLVGMMGSGKTTVGSLIAQKIHASYIDIDSLIEKEAGKSINQIFETYGEELFRKLETKTIKKYSAYHNQVVSTGGGAVTNPVNIRELQKNSVLFYLKAKPKELFERIKEMQNRPLLKQPHPLGTLEKLLKEREKFYLMADYTINTENRQAVEIIDEIIEKYNEDEKAIKYSLSVKFYYFHIKFHYSICRTLYA